MDWKNLGADAVELLLKNHFAFALKPVLRIERLVEAVLKPFIADGMITSTDEMTVLNKKTFPKFYQAAFDSLAAQLNKIDFAEGHPRIVFQQIARCVALLEALVDMIKVCDAPPVLATTLRSGRVFMDSFLRHCMPLMTKNFGQHRDTILLILATLQKSTRPMQNLCNHAKGKGDAKLTAQVPFVKKLLESILLRVKSMLADNQSLQAFWVGNLKHKNLQGREVASQLHGGDDSEDDEDDAEDTAGDDGAAEADDDDIQEEAPAEAEEASSDDEDD
eukprot:TRINITY_DN10600_c0_g1_i2.p1 TRINITY_DN10600_c0_g1~~TRINITY_DN10600_c0_g1_i2.p1  ORF type:complete len:276 (-),score=90.64 TRINITY_DN10600_c0_g1_i2:26-853(-)